MLFWLFVIILVVSIVVTAVACEECWEFLSGLGAVVIVLSLIATIVSGIIMACNYIDVDARIAENNERYESLVYQLENNLYDNDNDLGKKELYNEIREWNEDLAYYQKIQDNFWVGIYRPNIYDQFQFIEYK